MVLRSFASNQPYTLLFAAAPVVVALVVPDSSLIPLDTVGYASEYLLNMGKSFGVYLYVILIIGGGLLANRLFNQNEFMNTPVYTPALMYMMVMTTLGMTQAHLPCAVANILVILGMGYQLKIFKQPTVLREVGLSGFLFGLAALIIPAMITLLPALIIGILINRPFQLREITVAVISFSLPFGYWVAMSYLFIDQPDYVLIHKTITLDTLQILKDMGWGSHVFSGLLILSMILSFRQFMHSERNSNRAKSTRIITMILAFFLFGSLLMNSLMTGKWLLQIIAFPVSFVIAYWFAYYRYSMLAPLFFYAICIVSVLLSFRIL
jgi:hypothetical protein